MGESSSWLAVLILTGYMTANEANSVWAKLSGQPVPSRPSEIATQVEVTLAQVRSEAEGFASNRY